FIQRAQSLHWGIGVGGRLKVSQEVAALAIAKLHSLEALIDLADDAGAGKPTAGAEAAVVAESAASGGNAAVDIGAGKTCVDADLLNTDAKPLPQMKICRKIRQARRAPSGLQVIARSRFS